MPKPVKPLTQMRVAWNRQRTQARFRSEPWDFSFEDWWAIWEPKWEIRGREQEDWCMIRVDTTKPWSPDNVQIVNRQDWLREINRGNQHRRNWIGRGRVAKSRV